MDWEAFRVRGFITYFLEYFTICISILKQQLNFDIQQILLIDLYPDEFFAALSGDAQHRI